LHGALFSNENPINLLTRNEKEMFRGMYYFWEWNHWEVIEYVEYKEYKSICGNQLAHTA
jgi:hypothetical protein